MFGIFGVLFGVIVVLSGLFLILLSKVASNKDYGNDESQIAKTKRNGIICIICGVILTIMSVVMIFL